MGSSQNSRSRSGTVAICPAGTIWRRAVWMRLGALNGLIALLVLILSVGSMLAADQAGLVRLGAQVQFMHAMATIACATFMNIGARGARLAPPFFQSGILLYCIPTYAQAVGFSDAIALIKPIGLGALTAGWLIVAWSARDIDKG